MVPTLKWQKLQLSFRLSFSYLGYHIYWFGPLKGTTSIPTTLLIYRTEFPPPWEPNWREKEVIEHRRQGDVVESDSDDDFAFGQPLKAPSISSVREAIELANQLAGFADWHGNEPLSSAVSRVSDVLLDVQLKSLTQYSIHRFFKP